MPQPIRSIIALVVLAIILSFPASGHPKCCSCDPEEGLNVPTTPGVVNYKPNHCAPMITGPDEVSRSTTPQDFSYGASSACCNQGNVAWTITGNNVSINPSTGVVTVAPNACGAFTVTATDACYHSASKTIRIANAGYWVRVSSYQCNDGGECCYTFRSWAGGSEQIIDGSSRKDVTHQTWQACPVCPPIIHREPACTSPILLIGQVPANGFCSYPSCGSSGVVNVYLGAFSETNYEWQCM
jgi:hypothetical protein